MLVLGETDTGGGEEVEECRGGVVEDEGCRRPRGGSLMLNY